MPMSKYESDAQLVKRVLKGDQQAFARLLERYKDAIYNLCYRMLGSPQEAEDASQETFLRLYASLGNYDSKRKFSTWALRIATNYCIDRLRRRHQGSVSLDTMPQDQEENSEPLIATLVSGELLPEEQLLRGEQSDEIERALQKLSPLYRTVLVLRYVEELSLDEIAEVLDIPVATVKTRLHRGREALRKALQQVEQSEHEEAADRQRMAGVSG